MRIKRLIVNVVSALVGAVVTWITIYGLEIGPVFIGFGTDARRFAYSNVAILFLSIAVIVWIWLDYLLDTQYLKG